MSAAHCVIVAMMSNETRLTPRGELVADVVTAFLFIGMSYAIVKAMAIVVVKLGQVLGIV